MTPIVLTPESALTSTGQPSVMLTPNLGEGEELVGSEGIVLAAEGNETLFPVPEFDENYSGGIWTEGGRRTRSRPVTITGQGHVHLLGTDELDVAMLERRWEKVIGDCWKYGGTLRYTPEVGAQVTYQVSSAKLLSGSATPSRRRVGVADSTFELTYQPYGHLAPRLAIIDLSADPVVVVDIPELDGSAEALGILSVNEPESQGRMHVEGGMESQYVSELTAWELFFDSQFLDGQSGTTVTSRANNYGTSVIRQSDLDADREAVATIAGLQHTGRFRVKARVYVESADVRVQVGCRVRGGQEAIRPWQTPPAVGEWVEVDLGVVNCEPPPDGVQSVRFTIYAKSVNDGGVDDIDLDWIKTFPVERYMRASGTVGSGTGTTYDTLPGSTSLVWRYDGIFTEISTDPYILAEHPDAIGQGLRIPRRGGRIAVSASRDAYGAGWGDNLEAELKVIPRVLLRGATL